MITENQRALVLVNGIVMLALVALLCGCTVKYYPQAEEVRKLEKALQEEREKEREREKYRPNWFFWYEGAADG